MPSNGSKDSTDCNSQIINKSTNTLLAEWCIILTTANRSLHTISAYKRDVSQMAVFLTSESVGWQNLSNNIIQSFVSKRLENDEISVASIQRELSSVRQFCSWLMQQQYISSNPLIGFKIKNSSRKLPEMVDIDTISQLLDQPAPSSNRSENLSLWSRDKAMFELLYSSGLRVSELTQLNIQDIDLSIKQIRVVAGKGNKTRIVPMGGKALEALLIWLDYRIIWLDKGETTDTKHAVFLGRPTKKQIATRLSTRTVQRRIQHHAQRAGIDKRMYPHLMRHCFASHLLSGSGDMRAVQELLGHADISTTQIYTHLDFEQLSKVYDSSHPRAKKKT